MGYSLCFGTILAKMVRVYYIFDNPSKRRKRSIKDWHLALSMALLVAIDCLILMLYNMIEGANGNLEARREQNAENPQDITGDVLKIINYYVYICDFKGHSITLGVLYSYKMLLQIIALIFAFSIRKVKIKGLNDTKFIAAAIYVTSIVTAIVIVITYTLNRHINIFASIFSFGFFIGATTILGLVMVPPLAKDPMGERIFQSDRMDSSNPRKMSLAVGLGSSQKEDEVDGLKKKIVELQSKLSLFGDLGAEEPVRTSKVTMNISEGSSPGTNNCTVISTNGNMPDE